MATSVCISSCGLKVDGEGKLALNIGTAPTTCDATNGVGLFCDADGVLRVPDYGGAGASEDLGPSASDLNYPETGGSLYRNFSEAVATYVNSTCRDVEALVIMTAVNPFMRVATGNGLIMGAGHTTSIVGVPAAVADADLVNKIQLNGAGFLDAGQYIENGFPNLVVARAVQVPAGDTLSVRFRVAYRTTPFVADAQNAITLDETRILITAAPRGV